jgi:hypothetical protein
MAMASEYEESLVNGCAGDPPLAMEVVYRFRVSSIYTDQDPFKNSDGSLVSCNG